jgi:hypothetical protein
MQNVGNFITDRPSSRVLAAPGGASQVRCHGVGGGMIACNRDSAWHSGGNVPNCCFCVCTTSSGRRSCWAMSLRQRRSR